MRRKGERLSKHPYKQHRIAEDIEPERLKGIGAVSLAWNDLEGAADTALAMSLKLPEPLWVELTSRINGWEGKVELLKKSASIHYRFSEDDIRPISETLGEAGRLKKYRDGVIHALILDPNQDVAPSLQRKGATDEVLVTTEALNALYNRLCAIRAELDQIVSMFHYLAIARTDLKPNVTERERQQAEQDFRACFPRLLALQQKRRETPQLPEFPEEAPSAE